jgi:hypothetical protein
MAHYKLPESVTALSDDELVENLQAAVRSFSATSKADVVGPDTLPALRELKAAIETLKEEQTSRTEAAEAAANEIDKLTAEVFGEDETTEERSEGKAPEAAESATEVVAPTAVQTADEVAASAGINVRRSTLNLAAVRARQSQASQSLSKYLAPETPDGIEIVASVDVPGFRPGQEFSLSEVTEGVMRRASSLQTAGGGTGLVASYRLPFPAELQVNDSSSAPEGSLAVMKAADQRRLPGNGDLVASGGWCAPSETVYAITDIACPDMLWDLPEIQLTRGGLRFFRTPALDVNALTWIHTEQDDIAGNTKPCFTIPCPDPIDTRAQAQGVCLESGILTQRFFPELIDWYVRNSMVAHEIRLKTAMYDQARTAATAVTMPATFASFSAVFDAVALQAADMIERYNLCDSTQLEVVFPWWVRNMFLADIARHEDVSPTELDPAVITAAFARLGVSVQFARGLAPAVGTDIGDATPATVWPATVEFMIYPSGNFQLARGPEINLGVIIDSVTVATNDQKMFSEEAVALIDRLGLARVVTVPVCADGSVGARTTYTCTAPEDEGGTGGA